MDQKHVIEDMFAGELPLTALQATLFMEEFWKHYTRPASEMAFILLPATHAFPALHLVVSGKMSMGYIQPEHMDMPPDGGW